MRGQSERSFGLSVGTVCALLAAWSLWRGRMVVAGVLGSVALALLAPALLRPSLLRIPSALWWRLAHALGWLNSRVLLTVVFFVLVTPMGLLKRLVSRVQGKATELSGSSWVASPARLRDPKHFERMY